MESINAYSEMETYYRPIIPDDGSFDTTRFSGFVELQKPGIKEAIAKAGFDVTHFSRWATPSWGIFCRVRSGIAASTWRS